MIEYHLGLIDRHCRNGILVDANLLLVLVLGRTNVNWISSFSRTSTYSVEDYTLLELIVRRFNKILSTPQVLTEGSNLATKLNAKSLGPFRDLFRQTIAIIDERQCTGKAAAANRYFRKLGLTDSGILALSDRRFLLLTDDFELSGVTQHTGGDVINFNHLRLQAWRERLSL